MTNKLFSEEEIKKLFGMFSMNQVSYGLIIVVQMMKIKSQLLSNGMNFCRF